MKNWQIAVVLGSMLVALFVAIDQVVKAQPWAHEPCDNEYCIAIIDKLWCTDKTEACRDARRIVNKICGTLEGRG